MIRYFIKRIFTMFVSVAGILFVVYLLMRGVPGANPYTRGMDHVFTSYLWTVWLTFLSILVSILVGIPLGITAAVNHNKPADHAISVLTFLLYALPPFVLAIYSILLFSLELNLLPVLWTNSWKHYIQPVAVLSASGIANLTRMTRSAVLDVRNRQYIQVLRSKGLPERDIFYKHVLKNIAPTVLTALNNSIVQIFCGTMIVEAIFVMPGLGSIIINSISGKNTRLILVCVFLLSMTLLTVNLLIDFLSALINPKIRAAYSSRK